MLNRRGVAVAFAVGSLVACGSSAPDDPTTPPVAPTNTPAPTQTTPPAPPSPPRTCEAQPLPSSEACLRISADLAMADEAHVIAIQEAEQAEGVRVKIRCTDKPITLVLAATKATKWIIEREAGSTVKKVFLATTTGMSTIEGLDASTVVEDASFGAVVSSYELRNVPPFFPQFIDSVRAKIGGLERTFQGTYKAPSFAVPPTAAPKPASFSHYSLPAAAGSSCAPATCAKKSTSALGWNFGNPAQPSTQAGATAIASGNQTWGFFQLNKGARCGKRYFELAVTRTGAQAPMIGVSALKGGPQPVFGSATPQSYSPTQSETVGVALDLDAGQVFYRRASGWVQSAIRPGPFDAAIGTTGTLFELWTYDEVRPAIDLPKGDSAEIRLAEPFTYPLPTGYAPGLD